MKLLVIAGFIEIYNFEIDYDATRSEFFRAVKLELPMWAMWIEGYTEERKTDQVYINDNGEYANVKEYKPITIGPVPWVIEQIAVNPIFIIGKISGWKLARPGDGLWIKYNIIHFPVVRIEWWSIEFNYEF